MHKLSSPRISVTLVEISLPTTDNVWDNVTRTCSQTGFCHLSFLMAAGRGDEQLTGKSVGALVSSHIHAGRWTFSWGIKSSATVQEAPVLKEKKSQTAVRGSNYGHIPKATHSVVYPLCKPSICTQLKPSRPQRLWIFESLAWGAEWGRHFLLRERWWGTPGGSGALCKSNLQRLLVPLVQTKQKRWMLNSLLHDATTGSGAFFVVTNNVKVKQSNQLHFLAKWNTNEWPTDHLQAQVSLCRRRTSHYGVWIPIFRSKWRLFMQNLAQLK